MDLKYFVVPDSKEVLKSRKINCILIGVCHRDTKTN